MLERVSGSTSKLSGRLPDKPLLRVLSGKKVRERARIIGFPRGAGEKIPSYVGETKVDAVSLETAIDRRFASAAIQSRVPVQGSLDPDVLPQGGAALDRAIDDIMAEFAEAPFIFNLGHGILPQTPIANVEQMLARVRGYRIA
jgi:uroporphyrinogen decarboxylase